MERSWESTGKIRQRCAHEYTARVVCQQPFAIEKEEQLVFDNRAANVSAILAALKLRATRIIGCLRIVTEQPETLAVEMVG